MPILLVIGAIIIAVGAGAFVYLSREPATTLEPEIIRIEEVQEIEIPEPETTDDEASRETVTNPDTSATTIADTSVVTAAPETFSATGNYLTPARTAHTVDLTLVLEGDTVADATIIFDGKTAAGQYSNDNQARFDAAYKTQVVGKRLSDISLSRVGGASLTSQAFNEAVATIARDAS